MGVSRHAGAVGLSIVLGLAGLGVGLSASDAGATQAQPASVERGAESPQLVLVKFHADWCPHCRVLNPVFDDVQASIADQPVLFVRVDKTDKAKARQAEYLTAELGLGQHWPSYGRRTGLVVLFDADTGKVVEEFNSSSTATEIRESIAAAL
jgi:thiol-disulfide isomerase/thioredoxin